jgi:hypothetical protein
MISSYRLKLDRARQHFDALDAEYRRFIEDEPHQFVLRFDPQTDEHVIRVQNVKSASERWPVLIGDCIYTFRSALDHIAWQLAATNGRQPPDRTEFPIFLDKAKYFRTNSDGSPHPASGLFKVRGIGGSAQTIIEGLQSYNRTDGPPALHPLWLLQELSNEDKHRVLNVISAYSESSELKIITPPKVVVARRSMNYGPIYEGAELARFTLIDLGVHPTPMLNVEVEIEGTLNIAFSQSGPGRGIAVRNSLLLIEAVINKAINDLTPHGL